MTWFNDILSSLRIWNKGHDYIVPVVSSVGNGAKGDKGDPFDYDQLTEYQIENFSSRVADKETLQNSVEELLASNEDFCDGVANDVEASLSNNTSFINSVSSQQNLQNYVSNAVLNDQEFIENTTSLLLDDENFSDNISDSILRIVSNINIGAVDIVASSGSIVSQVDIPQSCNYAPGDNVLVFINGLLENNYNVDTANARIILTTGLSHSATMQILVFKLTV